ncbi:triphosphoribosyl-dephospho-CoA synthase CitG [Klebsiella quasipneumoniae]|uniref:triphosphoribosyl-dephospho-CoA synthase CitG n=1 Tax=Klebsiella quasipneumoniae TaxID=1463165 RepID=UPI00244ADC07|nr:triphosphoribosyl-dephospho-CoA synthase CitG [Klebsiella quasipneumoniae]MDH2711623.1 triphosphoribosyl-dephospho-CoA synthase CitG [Klebsiella quasipneumoniae]
MSDVLIQPPRVLRGKPLSAEEVVSAVERALLTEVRLTPKPGLVDIRNAGAHRDMDLASFEATTTVLASFEASTVVVAPWMEKFFIMGHDTAAVAPEQVLMMLRPVGMACENDMLEVTGGVNTHRGAIFAFGLLSAAAGRLVSKGEPIEQHRLCDQVARFCRGMVMQELSSASGERLSKGEMHFLRYGFSGARGEAESGFLTVRTQALPVFNRMMEETGDSNLALLQTLLHLMAWNDDTNLVSRGGLAGLNYVQQEAQRLLWQGGVLADGGLEALRQFDDDLIARHLSPGGSADLLAVTWFLSAFPAGALFPL